MAGAAAPAAKAAKAAAAGRLRGPGTAARGLRRPRPTGAAGTAAVIVTGAEVVHGRARRARAAAVPPAEPPKGAPVPAQPVAKGDNEHEEEGKDHHGIGQDGEQAVHRRLQQAGLRSRGGLGRRAVGIDGAAAEADAVDFGDRIGRVGGTGEDGCVILLGCKVVFHGLGDRAGLAGQHRVAEAVAVGQVVVAVGVLRRLHHQQDQHAVVVGAAADAPGVESLGGVVLRGDAAGVIHGQHADLGPLTAGRKLGVDRFDLFDGVAAEDVGIVHDALIFGQIGQGSRSGQGGGHEGGKAHHHHQCQRAEALRKMFHRFHAKGSTSWMPNRPFSTLAGKPSVSC